MSNEELIKINKKLIKENTRLKNKNCLYREIILKAKNYIYFHSEHIMEHSWKFTGNIYILHDILTEINVKRK